MRRVFRNEWTNYATLMMRHRLNAFGHVAATEMYEALFAENRNGETQIQATTDKNEGAYIRSRPYATKHLAKLKQ